MSFRFRDDVREIEREKSPCASVPPPAPAAVDRARRAEGGAAAAAVAAAVAAVEDVEDVGSRSRAAATVWEREGRARQGGGEGPEVEVRPREGGHERERVEPRGELDNAARERDRPRARERIVVHGRQARPGRKRKGSGVQNNPIRKRDAH